jgi:cytidine deaminase
MIDDQTLNRLIDGALNIRLHAYAPYSKFKVGVALLAKSGEVYYGVNMENAIYRATHGESSALNQAIIADEREFVAIAVATDLPIPAVPCGQCRQDLREFNDGSLEIIAVNLQRKILRTTLEKLLPHSFGPEDLGVTEE